jgi:DUF1365 family protein
MPMPSPIRSGLYVGEVRHARSTPTTHRFTKRAAYFVVDLDELPSLSERLRLLSLDRRNVVSLRSSDHFEGAPGPPAGPGLRTRALAFAARNGLHVPPGTRVRLLTQARVLGYVFNPVSFWWFHREDGTVLGVIAEINNTFGERHPQVLAGPGPAYVHPKELHVSPFLGLDHEYRSTLPLPGDQLSLRMEVVDASGRRPLVATVRGERRPLDDRNLLRFLAIHPLLPHRGAYGIHREALTLWWKKVPFHRKPPFVPGEGSVRP